ncbi:retrovirus-related pol polyprotein from transposon TNT 1-94 [Tanacetum coccineum]
MNGLVHILSKGHGADKALCACCKIFGHVHDECPKNKDSDVVKNMKKPSQTHRGVPVGHKTDAKPTIEVSNSNPFDVLNSVENDVDLGTNGGTSNLASKKANSSGSSFWNVESSSTSTTPIVEKIDKMERFIIDGKVTLVDDEGKLLTREIGYGTNSLLEQWKESYGNGDYDYDPYDDDMYEGQDIPDKIQDICDNLDIKVRGRKKK